MERLDLLATAIQEDSDLILNEWKKRVRSLPQAKTLDRLTLEDGVRTFLDEISNTLAFYHDKGQMADGFSGAPVEHGLQRFEIGFDLNQLVLEYSMLRAVLMDCAARHSISLDGGAGHVLHEAMDRAMLSAVASYVEAQAAQHEGRVQQRVSTVVHDLKTPLSSIHTAAHILDGRLSPDSKKSVATMLGIILRNCDNLNAMLLKLLENTSKTQMVLHAEFNRTEVDLCSLVGELIESVRPLAQKAALTISNDIPHPLSISADPFLLKQMMQNLLSNALKYTEHGTITVGAAQEPHRVRIWVEDTGVGMLPEKVAQLFIESERDPAKPESTGMGLSIVKKIVDAHSGNIGVESEVGIGTTFTVFLPSLRVA
jgi:signal transduction histidine kinase